MAVRDPRIGTWMVKAVTDALDALTQDVDLLIFLTNVQKAICRWPMINENHFCQTPELRLFPSSQIFICNSHNNAPENHPLNTPEAPQYAIIYYQLTSTFSFNHCRNATSADCAMLRVNQESRTKIDYDAIGKYIDVCEEESLLSFFPQFRNKGVIEFCVTN